MATRAFVNGFTTAGTTIVPAPIVLSLTGTITCVAGTKKVTGTGTAFLTELTRYIATLNPDGKASLKGQYLIIADTQIAEIDYVLSDTILYLKQANIAGFSGAASRAVNAMLLDCTIVAAAKSIIVPGGTIVTPTDSVPLVMPESNSQVVVPFIAPAACYITSGQEFEYYLP